MEGGRPRPRGGPPDGGKEVAGAGGRAGRRRVGWGGVRPLLLLPCQSARRKLIKSDLSARFQP